MPAAVFAVIAGLFVAGWAVSAWAKGRKVSGTNPASDALPPVKAMLVGHPEAGKTMQLAAMYHQLAIGENGVRLLGDERTVRSLGGMVSHILSPAPQLPAGNAVATISNWEFEVQARGRDTDELRSVFRLTYSDYAGEHNKKAFQGITVGENVPTGAAAQAFQAAIRGHDVLLGVLDGAKISQAMRGKAPEGLELDIWQTLALLSLGQQKIVHLVLTKWDEFDKYGITLPEVLDHLDRYQAFRDLRTVRAPGRLRLIPVSAFGTNGYLSVGPNGITKDHAQVWRPLNAGLPFACGLTDIVKADLERIETAAGPHSKKFLTVVTSPVFTALLVGLGLTSMATNPVHLASAALAGRKIGLDLELPVGQIIETFREVFGRGSAGARSHGIAEPLLELPGRQDQPARKAATAHLLGYCIAKTRDLDVAFPGSDLTR